MNLKWLMLAGLATELYASMQQAAVADPVPEYTMKAAFLYNFALFTEWPDNKDGNIKLCLFGKDMFGPAIDTIDGKQVNGSRIVVSRRYSLDNLRDCDMLYISPTERHTIDKIKKTLGDLPILTITDAEGLVQSGVIIEMGIENNRLSFEVNAHAARQAHIAISSKLLRLARTVY